MAAVCRKVPYASRAAAQRARGKVGWRKDFRSRLRVYECPLCHHWHLTSEGLGK